MRQVLSLLALPAQKHKFQRTFALALRVQKCAESAAGSQFTCFTSTKVPILTRAGGAAHGGQRAAAVQRLLVGTAVRREAAAIEVMDAWVGYLAEEQAERADAYERAKDEQVLRFSL